MLKSKKAPKFKRRPDQIGGMRLQERDIQIMRLVYEFRFLDSDQIKAVIDGSNQVILRRLQRLFHHGFLDRPRAQQALYPVNGPQKMVYALGDRGADLLAEKFGVDRGKIKWNEKNKEVGDPHIKHTLMVSNFRICLELGLRDMPNVNLLFWRRENPQQLKDQFYIRDKRGRKTRAVIVPDSFFAINDTRSKVKKGIKSKMYFFLEADQSTMTNERFLKKMRAYWHWGIKEKRHIKKFSITAFRVLTITKTEQRKENLRKITKKADESQTGSPMFWFTSEKNYAMQNPETILGPIWQTPKDDSFHSILE